MAHELRTIRGYDFYECASALQKAVRRNSVRTAAFFGVELWESGYGNYVWKRLFTISAEDCWGLMTKEIYALYKGYCLVNEKQSKPKGRVFIAKAVILLCECLKSRDADHLNNLVVDNIKPNDAEIEGIINEIRSSNEIIPSYTYDVHTLKGKKMGKTKEQFFKEEFDALKPRQLGLFDNLV